MKHIRNGVFETNSSSTHSLVICTKEEYDKWGKETLLNEYTSKYLPQLFITYEQAISYLRYNGYDVPENKDELLELLHELDIHHPLNYFSDELESYKRPFTTPSGDKMIAFGQYGRM